MSTQYKILVGDTATPQARVPKTGVESYLAPVTLDAATGDEVAFEIATIINKATSGDYTGLKLLFTETAAPGTGNKFIEVLLSAVSMFSLTNAGLANFAGGVTGPAVPRVDASASDTILATDNGKVLIYTSGSAVAVTLPDDLDVNFHCSIIQAGAGVVTVTRSGADTINGAATGVTPSAQWKGMYLNQFAAGEFLALL